LSGTCSPRWRDPFRDKLLDHDGIGGDLLDHDEIGW
jgi:hypothetical protein